MSCLHMTTFQQEPAISSWFHAYIPPGKLAPHCSNSEQPLITLLDSLGSSGYQTLKDRKIQTKGRDIKQNFVRLTCKSLRLGMGGSEIGERGKSWILEHLEFCSKELICRREGSPKITQSGKNQGQVVIQKDLKAVWRVGRGPQQAQGG